MIRIREPLWPEPEREMTAAGGDPSSRKPAAPTHLPKHSLPSIEGVGPADRHLVLWCAGCMEFVFVAEGCCEACGARLTWEERL